MFPKQENPNMILWRLYIFLRAQLTNWILQVHVRINLIELELIFPINYKHCGIWTQQCQKCNEHRWQYPGGWMIRINLCRMIVIRFGYFFLEVTGDPEHTARLDTFFWRGGGSVGWARLSSLSISPVVTEALGLEKQQHWEIEWCAIACISPSLLYR